MPEIHLSQRQLETTIEAVDEAIGEASENGNEEELNQLQAVLRKMMQESETHS